MCFWMKIFEYWTFLKISDVISFVDTCELIPGKVRNLAEDFKV